MIGDFPDLTKHTTFTNVKINSNGFTGSMGSLAGMSNLYELQISWCMTLIGDIPSFADCTSLYMLYLYDCAFTGYAGGDIPTVQYIRVENNDIDVAGIDAIIAGTVNGTVSYSSGTTFRTTGGTNGVPTNTTGLDTLCGRYTDVSVNGGYTCPIAASNKMMSNEGDYIVSSTNDNILGEG